MVTLNPPGQLGRRPLGPSGLVVDPICIGCTPHGGNAPSYVNYRMGQRAGRVHRRSIGR